MNNELEAMRFSPEDSQEYVISRLEERSVRKRALSDIANTMIREYVETFEKSPEALTAGDADALWSFLNMLIPDGWLGNLIPDYGIALRLARILAGYSRRVKDWDHYVIALNRCAVTHYALFLGHSPDYQDSPYWTGNVAPTMASLREEGLKLLPDIRVSDYIRNFSGLRAKQTPPEVGGNADFVVEDRRDVKGFINVLGIESPGLTSSPAIAEMVAGMVKDHLPLDPNPSFNGDRPGSDLLFSERTPEERAELIAADPDYGEMICRCESVSKREVLDALNNPLGAKTFVSLKYRSRVSMGRCQGGFCIPRIARLLYEEFGWKWEDFVDHSERSAMFAGKVLNGGELR